MGSFKDFFGGLLSKGHKGGPVLTRNPAHLELKGCTDAECTLATPNDTRVKMGLRKDEADAKIQARDAEIAVLKAQLSEYRTFKDPDTDNVDLP
jgi:hypothetical protein